MRISVVTYLLLIAIVLNSCNEKRNITEIAQYINSPENGLTKVKELGPLTYTARYETPEIMTYKELGRNGDQSPEFKKLLKERKDYFQIVLRVASSEEDNNVSLFKKISKDKKQQFELNNYFQNFAQVDFEFLIDGESYAPTVYQFMSANGATPYEEIVLGFDKSLYEIDQIVSKIQLVYNDEIFKHGPIYFTYNNKDIQNIPYLNF